LPRESWEIPSDPYFTGIMIGQMHRPHGKIRCVTWYQAGVGAFGDPDGWEKRVVQRFDEEGRCVETEAWAMGVQEDRRIVDLGSVSRPPQNTYWFLAHGSCERTRLVRDDRGRARAVIREDLNHLGLLWEGSRSRVAKEYERDAWGRVREATSYRSDGAPEERHRWNYDSVGRVHVHESEHCKRDEGYREEFEYGADDRLRATVMSVAGGEPSRRSEYSYDADGRLESQSERIGGVECWTMACTYGANGRLAVRVTSDRRIDAGRNRPRSTLLVETFDGIDRPLTRELRDARGRVLERGEWTYKDDERGNWVLKSHTGTTNPEIDVRRIIEYAE
jgi:hypothetical protein